MALTRARCAPTSDAAAALVRAAVCAPLPGLDYHLDAALFSTKDSWDFVAALVDDGGRGGDRRAPSASTWNSSATRARGGARRPAADRGRNIAAAARPLETTRRAAPPVARRLWLGVLVDALLSPAARGGRDGGARLAGGAVAAHEDSRAGAGKARAAGAHFRRRRRALLPAPELDLRRRRPRRAGGRAAARAPRVR